MNKKLVTIGIILILIFVGFSGCNEESKKDVDNALKSVTIILESIA